MKELIRPKSIEAFKQAQQFIPGGVNSPVRAFKSVGGTPLFIKRAKGSTLIDIDDNEYIDLCLSWGVFILGHSHPLVNRAIHAAVDNGSSYGIPTLQETQLAETVHHAFPSMEKVRFVNSGTEATMSAIRVARGFTKRDTIVKFEGCYHGHADHLLVGAGSGVTNIQGSTSAGVPIDFTRHTVCLPYNDKEALNKYFIENGRKVAAIIVEPVACNMGVVIPENDYLAYLRQITEEYGALLIFDEVITGFRLSYGGAQEVYDITPDLTAIGKIIGGGFPAAAFGGKAEIMNMLAPDGPVYQAGTLSGNPVAMAAGIATTDILAQEHFYEHLSTKFDTFIDELKSIVRNKDLQLNSKGNMYTLFFNNAPVHNFEDAKHSDQKRFALYFHNMLNRGIYVSPSQFEGNFLSEAHSENDLERILKAIKESI